MCIHWIYLCITTVLHPKGPLAEQYSEVVSRGAWTFGKIISAVILIPLQTSQLAWLKNHTHDVVLLKFLFAPVAAGEKDLHKLFSGLEAQIKCHQN